jgi:hypothetical protein
VLPKALSPKKDRMLILLAVFIALVVSLFLTFCVPAWASISITLAALVLVAKGGGALLAKGFVAAASVVFVVWLLRHLRQKRLDRISTEVRYVTMRERTAQAKARPRQPERLAYEAFIPLTTELKPSAKYRIAGKVTGTAVEAWLEDAETKERMSSVAMAPFGKQAVQAGAVPIFIPVRR